MAQPIEAGRINVIEAIPGGRPYLSPSGEVSLRQLVDALPRVAKDERESLMLREVLFRAAITLGGLQLFGGGIARNGEVMRPQDLTVQPGQVYIPHLADLPIPQPLHYELAQRQMMYNYRSDWIERHHFDPQPLLSPSNRAAMSFLVSPGMSTQKYFEAERALGEYSKYYYPFYDFEKETVKKHIVKLYEMYHLPIVVPPMAIYRAIMRDVGSEGQTGQEIFPLGVQVLDVADFVPGIEVVAHERRPVDFSDRSAVSKMETPLWQDAREEVKPYMDALAQLAVGEAVEGVVDEGETLNLLKNRAKQAARELGIEIEAIRSRSGTILFQRKK